MTKEQLVEFLMSRGITKEATEPIVLIAELGGLGYEKVWEYYKDYPNMAPDIKKAAIKSWVKELAGTQLKSLVEMERTLLKEYSRLYDDKDIDDGIHEFINSVAGRTYAAICNIANTKDADGFPAEFWEGTLDNPEVPIDDAVSAIFEMADFWEGADGD